MRSTLLVLMTALAAGGASAASDEKPADALTAGNLAAGEETLAKRLAGHPGENDTRFALGLAQTLRGVEHLGQFLTAHGTGEAARRLPVFRLPIPVTNPDPQPTTYADQRQALETLLADLTKAEATLAGIKGEVKLPVAFGLIRLDLDGNGNATEAESLWRVWDGLNRRNRNAAGGLKSEQAEGFVIAFDRGDALWLRGYCHLLAAAIEFQLAHDGQRWFDHCGHLLFPNAVTPYPFLKSPTNADGRRLDESQILDAVAAIHLLNFPLTEPQRMAAAREHLLAVTRLSHESWDAILAETDDDREWLPSPRQTSVLGVPVTEKQIATWREMMTEAELLLEGEKLLPFWRDSSRGINLKRVFTEPRDFDWMLWIQGTAAAPYLEAGPTTQPQSWREWTQAFGGNFGGFAVWFN